MMYTVDVKIHLDKIPAEQKEALFAAHEEWIQANYEAGHFLLMGPYTTKETTGLIIGQAKNLEAVEAIMQADAFYPDYADYAINAFAVNKINPTIAQVK